MTNKPKLSDVARQTNSARVSKFAASMIPAAPVQKEEPQSQPDPSPEPVPEASVDAPAPPLVTPSTSASKPVQAVPATELTSAAPEPTAKTRKRSGSLSLEDLLSNKAPDGENFGKMTRIAEKHHDLLREIAFKHRKNMNTILYNLLEVLDQTYQREQQNHA